MLVRISMASRFTVVETVRMADCELARIQGSDWKRVWKYGAAARNMFLGKESG